MNRRYLPKCQQKQTGTHMIGNSQDEETNSKRFKIQRILCRRYEYKNIQLYVQNLGYQISSY